MKSGKKCKMHKERERGEHKKPGYSKMPMSGKGKGYKGKA